ncbi:MAG: DUF1887 family protein [Lachnospiraceae bacterium]|nr:DUF1887 family protein [Lachnospiraceae bacterium]
MKERQYLEESILLWAESDEGKFKRTFTIVKKAGEGAFAVCYEAYHENSGRGILKEFDSKKKEVLEPYKMMQKARQEGREELSSFIPDFEIYYGCEEEDNGTGKLYLWTPDPKLETFDKICDEIHKSPENLPEHKMVMVLSAVENLTKCICELHKAGMIHRDIKPSNFGFLKRGEEILFQTLSMFDIDSVCSVYHIPEEVVGTEGYMEPELGYERTGNQTDIYAIGATLFHALVVTEETRERRYLYQENYYDRLGELVEASRLVQASEGNSHPRLRNILTVILKRCLCQREERYENCEELLEDLSTALYYALPSEIAGKARTGEKWILADAEKSLDQKKERNSALAMQYHLYEEPLYRFLPKEEDTLNVLVIGFGNYGQKFLDLCLQTGQTLGKMLHVTVVSDDKVDETLYLSERPELADFFQIVDEQTKEEELEEIQPDRENIYGTITFEVTRLKREDPKANADILENHIMCEHYDTHYVFIALGEDQLNQAAAETCESVAVNLELQCVISYVQEEKNSSLEKKGNLRPVYVKEEVKESELYPEIERMAFNTHLIWEKSLNTDYRTVRAGFLKPYNHYSCISNVLSLKYKFYYMGIDLEQFSFEEAAKIFQEKVLGEGEKNRKLRDELIWMEHRRWVTEKLCQGWKKISDLRECRSGNMKDERRKRHVCILPSRSSQELAENPAYWEEKTERRLSKLDALDYMSVKLHQMFVKEAEQVRKGDLLGGENLAAVQALAEKDEAVIAAYQEWSACLKEIWNKGSKKVWLYQGLKNALLHAAEALSGPDRKSMKEQIKAFETRFYPVLASMEYRDYKQDDAALIDNIPFVLTYTEALYLAVPFAASGDNSKVFQNVASATVCNPSRILYLCAVEKGEDALEIKETIPYVMAYMDRKQIRSNVEFVIAHTDQLSSSFKRDLEELEELYKERIKQIKFLEAESEEEIPAQLEEYLKKRKKSRKAFAVEKNKTDLSLILKGAGIYQRFPSFQFDSAAMKFHSLVECDLFGYIKKTPYLTVTDMVSLRRSRCRISRQPEFFEEYKDLWKQYCKDPKIWKSLCGMLGDYAEENEVIASFEGMSKSRKEGNEERKYTYILPLACRKNASQVVDFLIKNKIAEEGSRVNRYTTDSCKVFIIDRCCNRKAYHNLFENIYALMIPEAIETYLDPERHVVKVKFDDLKVKGAFGNVRQEDKNKCYELMRFFQDKGYLINLKMESKDKDGRVNLNMSFTYATRQIKELLTKGGRMLEIYVYHKIRESGIFDDVMSSFEIEWEQNPENKNEFDCILTKGFQTVFVECKAVKMMKQDYYYKLKVLAEQFGINVIIVMLRETQEKSYYDTAKLNKNQEDRGRELNVITIREQEEIEHIDETLQKIVEGAKYVRTKTN